MGTEYEQHEFRTGNTALPLGLPTPEAFAAFGLAAPFEATKRALMFEARAGYLNNPGAADVTDFALYELVGDRKLIPHLAPFHPVLVTAGDGAPAVLFGRGGSGGNAISATNNGNLVCETILDSLGNETNNLPLFQAGTGWSFGARFKVYVPGATADSATWPAGSDNGGILFGSRAAFAGNKAFMIFINGGSGRLSVRNQYANESLNPSGTAGPDLRDSTWHDLIIAFNPSLATPANATMTAWLDGTQIITRTAAMADIDATDPATALFRLGGQDVRFVGALRKLMWLPNFDLMDATKRGIARAWLNQV